MAAGKQYYNNWSRKVHQDAMRSALAKAAEAIGRCAGGLTTKIHAKVDAFGCLVKSAGTISVIPSKINRIYPTDHDQHIYKERNIVERFFQKVKRFRTIATRYDKTARMYLSSVMMVGILIALKL